MSVINTNIQAIAAARNLNRSQEMLGRSLNRLSSGSKIVNPSDDAAGLAVSEKLDAQNLRVRAATTNVQNAISFVQTSDGFMGGMTKILSRMSELALLAKDVTKNSSDVALYQQEFHALQDQLRQTIGGTTAQIGGTADIDTPLGQFNGITLFGDDSTTPPSVTAGTYTPGLNMVVQAGAVIGAGATFGDNAVVGAGARVGDNAVIGDDVSIGANAYIAPSVVIGNNVTIQPGAVVTTGPIPDGTVVGATATSTSSSGLIVSVGQAVGQTMTIPQINLRDGAMGAIIQQDTSGNYVLSLDSSTAIGDITNAIQDVANERASLGASQSRLELASSTLQVEFENLSSAISRIRDVDVADESTQFAKYNILVQSGTAMLAQANQTPQSVLKLLQG
jgi:flagellin-like hook-associated protein FlgL